MVLLVALGLSCIFAPALGSFIYPRNPHFFHWRMVLSRDQMYSLLWECDHFQTLSADRTRECLHVCKPMYKHLSIFLYLSSYILSYTDIFDSNNIFNPVLHGSEAFLPYFLSNSEKHGSTIHLLIYLIHLYVQLIFEVDADALLKNCFFWF